MNERKPVLVSCKGVRGIIDPRTIQRRAVRLLQYLGLDSVTVSIFLCDDAVIRALNREYRHKDMATDVLSFSMNEGEALVGDSGLLGDIVVSVETAVRQAPAAGSTTTREVTSLMIHGLLHLLGYTHSNRADEKKMQQMSQSLEAEIDSPIRPRKRSKMRCPPPKKIS